MNLARYSSERWLTRSMTKVFASYGRENQGFDAKLIRTFPVLTPDLFFLIRMADFAKPLELRLVRR